MICLFGSLRRGDGLTYMGIVKTKKIIDEVNDDWPFKSPSGTHWKYVFSLSVYKINISPIKARELRGWNKTQSWQTQTKLSEGKNSFMIYLNINYPDYLIYPDGRVWSKPRINTKGGFLKQRVWRGYKIVEVCKNGKSKI